VLSPILYIFLVLFSIVLYAFIIVISAPSLTVCRQRRKTFLFRRSSPGLIIIWHSEFTFCCGPSGNFVIWSQK